MKAIIIIPYFGKWPVYFRMFLESCEHAGLLDFLFITDLQPPVDAPRNVFFVHKTLREIADLVQNTIGIIPALSHAYKLCDLKPAFGEIFQDYIKQYPFWGFGDVDLILGNIEQFINKHTLTSFDVISGRKLWVSGALCLIRNKPMLNSLYRSTDFYKTVFSDHHHYSFTECSKEWQALLKGTPISEIPFKYPNFTYMLTKAADEGKIRIRFEDFLKESIPSGGYIHFKNNRILDDHEKEYMLFHYIMAKRNPWFTYPDWELLPPEFYITETGFHTPKEFHDTGFSWQEKIKKISAFPGIVQSYAGRIIKKLKRMISDFSYDR